MKMKKVGIVLLWLASAGFVCAATNDITGLVQQGLFEEEANHHLDAAISNYQEAIGNFDRDRELAATAIFHLGECYRLQGKTNEANVQYERIVREFSEQKELVKLSRNYLPAVNLPASNVPGEEGVSADEQAEIQKIKDMIQNRPDVLYPSDRLIDAAHNGWMAAARLLLENGADINALSGGGYSALCAAASAGNNGMVELLLSKGANINKLGGSGLSPLSWAAQSGFKTILETLLSRGTDANGQDRDGDRPLHLAALNDRMALAELLLGHGADVNAPGKDEETALFRAIQNNLLDMVEFLISNKASVNIKSKSGTPLLWAVGNPKINIAIVKALLDNEADVDATVWDHHPLDTAIENGWDDLVELLLDKNADPNAKARWKVQVPQPPTPIFGAFIDQIVTPLILAISKGSDAESKIVTLLLEHSANPNLADDAGLTPLDYAIGKANTNFVGELILHHADVNKADSQGKRPLDYLSYSSYPAVAAEMKQMLIAAGANEDYRRREGIFIAQEGTGSIGQKVFSQDAHTVNHYTLFDLIATDYGGQANWNSPAVSFPDLSHLMINRLTADGRKKEIPVNLEEALQSGDCSKNIQLQWGDIVLIPQLDHNVGENWPGLSQSNRDALGKCLLRKVELVVDGQSTKLTLLPAIMQWYYFAGSMGGWGRQGPFALSSVFTSILDGEKPLFSFDLNQVVHQANVLRISSDLSRVKVTRRGADIHAQPVVMEFNLEAQPPPNIQLQDGDVIEIPERAQN
jgi:ankyrin repeat protein